MKSPKKKAGSDEEKAAGAKESRPREGDFHAPPSPRWGTDARSSPARRSAAVRMGRGGTARPPEAEWSSGVAAILGGGCYNQDIYKDPEEKARLR